MTFDLERARGLRDFLQDDCAEVGDVWGEMIAEIERLRAALAESEKIVEHKSKSATHWYDEHLRAQTDLTQSKRVIDQQAARIKELESSLDEAEALTKKNAELMNGYLARITELEGALVEERAGVIRCESYDHCEIDLPDAMIRAQQELQADGKIGPDATKPRSWQITEERMRAIRMAEELAWDCKAVAVLRAMLREAE